MSQLNLSLLAYNIKHLFNSKIFLPQTSLYLKHPSISYIPPSHTSLHLIHPSISNIPPSHTSLHLIHPSISYIPPSHTSLHLKHLSISNIPPSQTSLHLIHPSISNISPSQTSLHLKHLSISNISPSQTSLYIFAFVSLKYFSMIYRIFIHFLVKTLNMFAYIMQNIFKKLSYLNQSHIVNRKTSSLACDLDGRTWSNTHDAGVDPCDSVRHQTGQWFQVVCFASFF